MILRILVLHERSVLRVQYRIRKEVLLSFICTILLRLLVLRRKLLPMCPIRLVRIHPINRSIGLIHDLGVP